MAKKSSSTVFDLPGAAAPSIEGLMAQALGLHAAGQIAQAEVLYRQVLQRQPQHAAALHRLGVVALQAGHPQSAVELIGRSLQHEPRDAEAHCNLGLAHQAMGQREAALQSLQQAVTLQPDLAEALSNLGNVLTELGRPAEALAMLDRALAARPGYLEALYNRGNALHGLGRFDDALASYEQVLAQRADIPQVHHNRARVLQDLGRHEEALQGHARALELAPRYASALVGRGIAHLALEQAPAALADFDAALALDAVLAAAHYGRGQALMQLRRAADAAASFERCLALQPTHADALVNLGNALQELRRHDEALARYDAALRLDADAAGVMFNRGNVLMELKRYDEAAAAYARVLALSPDYPYALGKRLHAEMMACRWDDLPALLAQVRQGIAEGRRVAEPFGFCGIATSPHEQRQCAEIFNLDLFPAQAPLAPRARDAGGRRLRLGYLCGEFRNQATAILMTELFELHDKGRFELHAFDNGWDDGSTLRRRIDAAFDHITPIAALGDDAAGRAIAERGIDILVNLNGYFGLGRTGVFARRPAPVQVNYLGFPGTLGAPYIDWIVADAQVIPAGEFGAYTEQVAWLPDSYQANDRQRAIADRTPTRAEAGLPEQGFVFCCFNNTYKITPEVFGVWMRLLQAVPGSVLWLLDDNAAATQALRQAAQARGVHAQRLVFAPRIRLDEHLARHRLADLFVDTLPYNAHTTASDALWAGLPLLSCRGSTFAGRVGASLLQALGLADALLADDLPAYERRAIQLATDPAALAALREALAARRATAPLFDTPRLCRHLEAVYLRMHEHACTGLPPQPLL
jgi:predicted O-linked N-acetylglucosamine transferase (SPINDLY family)